MATPIVDAHLHIWEMPSAKYPWSPLRDMHPAEPGPVELLLDTMQQNGVDHAIIVQPSNYGYDHRYVVDSMRRFPKLFGGVALLDFTTPDAPRRVAELHSQGFKAVRLFLYKDPDLSWVSPAMDPVMQAIADLDMIVTAFGPWWEMDRIRRLAQRFPTVRFVVDHLGHPEIAHQETWLPVLQLAELPALYIKISDFPHMSRQAYPWADVFPFVHEIYAAFGAGRMMWASNFPQSLKQNSYADLMGVVDLAFPRLPAADRDLIMGGTAAHLWELGG